MPIGGRLGPADRAGAVSRWGTVATVKSPSAIDRSSSGRTGNETAASARSRSSVFGSHPRGKSSGFAGAALARRAVHTVAFTVEASHGTGHPETPGSHEGHAAD